MVPPMVPKRPSSSSSFILHLLCGCESLLSISSGDHRLHLVAMTMPTHTFNSIVTSLCSCGWAGGLHWSQRLLCSIYICPYLYFVIWR